MLYPTPYSQSYEQTQLLNDLSSAGDNMLSYPRQKEVEWTLLCLEPKR